MGAAPLARAARPLRGLLPADRLEPLRRARRAARGARAGAARPASPRPARRAGGRRAGRPLPVSRGGLRRGRHRARRRAELLVRRRGGAPAQAPSRVPARADRVGDAAAAASPTATAMRGAFASWCSPTPTCSWRPPSAPRWRCSWRACRSERIAVCPPGIDYGAASRRAADAAPRAPEHTIVSPGRLVWEKGHQDVLRALAAAAPRHRPRADAARRCARGC